MKNFYEEGRDMLTKKGCIPFNLNIITRTYYVKDYDLESNDVESYTKYLEFEIYEHQLRSKYKEEQDVTSSYGNEKVNNIVQKYFLQIIRLLENAYLKYRVAKLNFAQISLLLYFIFTFSPINVFCQNDFINSKNIALQIGDTIPNTLWELPLKVINHPNGRDTIRLSDYRDRGILLNFISSGCKGCIEALPELERIISFYDDDIVLIPVTMEKHDRMSSFFNQNEYTKNSKLTVITDDRILKELFIHRYISHVVWIDKEGIVRSFSNTAHIQDFTIADFLAGNTKSWPVKHEFTSFYESPIVSRTYKTEHLPNNEFKQLKYIAFTGYLDGVGAYYATSLDTLEGVERISIRNVSLLDLGLISTGLGLFKRGSVLKQDSSSWKVLNTGKYAFELYSGKNLTRDQWYQLHAVSYERTIPLGTSNADKYKLMIEDIKTFLGIDVIVKGDGLFFYEF